jgi:hypothetical protein
VIASAVAAALFSAANSTFPVPQVGVLSLIITAETAMTAMFTLAVYGARAHLRASAVGFAYAIGRVGSMLGPRFVGDLLTDSRSFAITISVTVVLFVVTFFAPRVPANDSPTTQTPPARA